jgi:hypothetical protein
VATSTGYDDGGPLPVAVDAPGVTHLDTTHRRDVEAELADVQQ